MPKKSRRVMRYKKRKSRKGIVGGRVPLPPWGEGSELEERLKLNTESKAKILREIRKKGPNIFVQVQQGYNTLNERNFHPEDTSWLRGVRSDENRRLNSHDTVSRDGTESAMDRIREQARQRSAYNAGLARLRSFITQQIDNGEYAEDIREQIRSVELDELPGVEPIIEDMLRDVIRRTDEEDEDEGFESQEQRDAFSQQLRDGFIRSMSADLTTASEQGGDAQVRQLINNRLDYGISDDQLREVTDAITRSTGSEHIGELLEEIINERAMSGGRKSRKRSNKKRQRRLKNTKSKRKKSKRTKQK